MIDLLLVCTLAANMAGAWEQIARANPGDKSLEAVAIMRALERDAVCRANGANKA